MRNQKEWMDFSVTDLSQLEEVPYTKEQFEKIVGDKFVAVKVNDRNHPSVIWTEKYVCPIKFEVASSGDCPVMMFPRNPDFGEGKRNINIKKSDVFDSTSPTVFGLPYWDCVKLAEKEGFSYIAFNGMVFNVDDPVLDYNNRICMWDEITE